MAPCQGDVVTPAADLVDEGHRRTWHQINVAVAEASAGPPAASLPPAPVPEIDVSCFARPSSGTTDDEERSRVVGEVLRAAQDSGFMNLVGHGVPAAVIDGALPALTGFFESPLRQKQRCIAQSTHGTQRGYSAYKSESHNDVLGRDGPPDLRETYCFGPAGPSGGTMYGRNMYPDFIQDFEQHIDAYYGEMESLEQLMLEIFTLALARLTGRPLSSNYLAEQIKPNKGLLKAAWYPACDPSPDDNRCSGHTDWGPLTILLTTTPGLEVCVKSAETMRYQWRSVPVVPGAFTINVADQLARWSNDKFVSCIHRVNANVACHVPRLSLAYFSTQVLPIVVENLEPKVECICAVGEEAKYEPLSVRDYLQRIFNMLSNGKKGGA
eukprot:TRINITY_DN15493_c0_g2_i3.p2 TRINITY_DN15493_c0_g2~~TRINITY_DN15493_c0_g2_i3.p2  ORF type:complete len:382 (+),score=55.92 TRINITY_DN15493_c0_g2_i3:1605-2750(+)